MIGMMVHDWLVWLVQILMMALIAAVVGMGLIDHYYRRKKEYIKHCLQNTLIE